MSSTFSLYSDAKIVELLNPATDAAGRTGKWVNAKRARKAFILVHIQQGAANTVLLSVQQAQNGAGLNAKVITVNVPILFNIDTSLTDTLVAQAAAVNFTTDAGLKNKHVLFEIDFSLVLDLVNGFQWFTIVTGASNVANITEANAICVGLQQHDNPPPSMVVA